MAELSILAPFILGHEGGYICDKDDRGKATNKGVTISTWRHCGYDINGDGRINVADLKLLTDEDVIEKVMRPHFWNKWHADDIRSQPVANMLVDWTWCSGKWGIILPQRILGVKDDGIVGDITLKAVNEANPELLFEKLKKRRIKYVNDIVRIRLANKKFLRGWLRRINSILYDRLINN